MDVYNKLGKADELLPLAKREQYMFTFRGKVTPLFHLSSRELETAMNVSPA